MPPRISDVVSKALDSGQLAVKRAEGTIAVSAGQVRLSNVTADSKDAALSLAGNLDLTDGSIDARLVLSGSRQAAGARPDIFMALKGPLAAPARSIDVSALTGWLTLRAVENQAKQLRELKRATSARNRNAQRQRETRMRAQAAPPPKRDMAPALPPPLDIRPVPAAAQRSAGSVSRPAELTAARVPLASRDGAAATVADLRAIVIEHEQADRRRQVAVVAVGVDRGHQIGQRHFAAAGDLLQAFQNASSRLTLVL